MTSHASMNPYADLASLHDSTSKPESADTDALSKSTLDRRAKVVANGQVPFPEDLPEGDAERLRLEVASRRRTLFVTFVARAIARDIQDGMKELQGGSQE